jgi:hypothetical protein
MWSFKMMQKFEVQFEANKEYYWLKVEASSVEDAAVRFALAAIETYESFGTDSYLDSEILIRDSAAKVHCFVIRSIKSEVHMEQVNDF